MKDHLRRLIDGAQSDLIKICLVREYLQARILQCLQGDGVFMRWAFLGGTALRFLYSLPRYSEDLDFSTLEPTDDAGFRTALRRIQATFDSEGYSNRIKVKEERTVVSAFILFSDLLFELDLSPLQSQNLSIKIEIDTNPPAGAMTESTLVRRHVTLNLHHYNKASLLAGKLHALLCRSWVKGRDLYDIIWYLADRSWPEPNMPMLNAALAQTSWSGPKITNDNWRGVLKERLVSVDLGKARSDVLPFLEREGDVDLLTLDNATKLLER
jgi:predicted nucleotidyltransferase component of viral defense system